MSQPDRKRGSERPRRRLTDVQEDVAEGLKPVERLLDAAWSRVRQALTIWTVVLLLVAGIAVAAYVRSEDAADEVQPPQVRSATIVLADGTRLTCGARGRTLICVPVER